MSRISIPIGVLTDRFNLSGRFDSVRSQSITQRFANLKPVSEFFDVRRFSKPRDFGDVQTRVNYNLGYFSSNYAVVFLMLSIYALLTNLWLLFDIIFVTVGMWVIGKLQGRDLELGTFRATTSQLYTGMAVIAIPVAFWASPISTVLWLIGASGGRPRAPYGVPLWGRPPGPRLGAEDAAAAGAHQSWDQINRFEEINDTEEEYLQQLDLRRELAGKGHYSDELLFDGIDYSHSNLAGRPYYDDPASIDEEEQFYRDYPEERPTPEPEEQPLLTPKEEELVARASERIARARAIGKTDIKLTQPEIDALNRLEQAKNTKPATHSKALTSAKKGPKARAIEASKKKRSNSPKSQKLADGRVRNSSNASTRSVRDDEEFVNFKIPEEPFQREQDFAQLRRTSTPAQFYQYSSYYGSPLRPGSRTASTQSLRGMPPAAYAPYYQNRFVHAAMGEGPYPRANHTPPSSRTRSHSRPEHTDPDSYARSRTSSSSSYRSHVADSHGTPNLYPRPGRFDIDDARHTVPYRRVVSGPAVANSHIPSHPRRHSDRDHIHEREELYPAEHSNRSTPRHDADGADRRTPSDSGSDPTYEEPDDAGERSDSKGNRGRYTIKTRAAAASSAVAAVGKTAKSTANISPVKIRRR